MYNLCVWFVVDCQNASKDDPVSLLVQSAAVQQFEESGNKQTTPGIVSWSPPLPNWNPWTSCNIDEGPLATVIWLLLDCLHIIYWSNRILDVDPFWIYYGLSHSISEMYTQRIRSIRSRYIYPMNFLSLPGKHRQSSCRQSDRSKGDFFVSNCVPLFT